jgi:hypothetical protein
LYGVVLVLAHVALLNLSAHVLGIRLKRSVQILFQRDVGCGRHGRSSSGPVYSLVDESALRDPAEGSGVYH